MSTHNIGFYEEMANIFFQLSSNIIKYALYLFCCQLSVPTCFAFCCSVSRADRNFFTSASLASYFSCESLNNFLRSSSIGSVLSCN